MTLEETIRLIFSFLGGGLVAGLLDWIRFHLSEKKTRKASRLQAQVHNLYGPLQFLTSLNESYFGLSSNFIRAYSVEYEGQSFSRNGETQRILKQERTQTLDIANAYIKLVTENNERIFKVLESNYEYIDPDDVEEFRKFTVDYTRLKTEIADSHLLTPQGVYERVGSISFMRPEFIERVKQKFNAKRKELDSLMA